ncbi:Imm1 family immunity protein [Hyalangium gracile]|uniref:Imm1 family immunity protein n=1 Tax=Hyalangium gracile TaxID=394092 RepID=UPI001CCD2A08|nr:Imm1 family immunity protein [Hyalangium gracile]
MSIVERLSVDGKEVSDSPEWDELEEAITEVESGGASTLGLFSADDAFAAAAAVPGLGFFLTVREEDDVMEMQLVQPERGDDLVEATIAGNSERHPRFAFVHRDLAIEALREFHASGKRKSSLTWMAPGDIS